MSAGPAPAACRHAAASKTRAMSRRSDPARRERRRARDRRAPASRRRCPSRQEERVGRRRGEREAKAAVAVRHRRRGPRDVLAARNSPDADPAGGAPRGIGHAPLDDRARVLAMWRDRRGRLRRRRRRPSSDGRATIARRAIDVARLDAIVDYVIIAAMADEPKRSTASRSTPAWSGDGMGSGEARCPEGAPSVPIAGATVLGGLRGPAPTRRAPARRARRLLSQHLGHLPEEARVDYAEPTLRVSGELGKDPAGGFRIREGRDPRPRAGALLAEQRAPGREDARARREVLHRLQGRARVDAARSGGRGSLGAVSAESSPEDSRPRAFAKADDRRPASSALGTAHRVVERRRLGPRAAAGPPPRRTPMPLPWIRRTSRRPARRASAGTLRRGRHVLGAERVQVERVFDRDALQTAGLSVVARLTRLRVDGDRLAADARGPEGAVRGDVGARASRVVRPSLTERSDDQRRSEPETPRRRSRRTGSSARPRTSDTRSRSSSWVPFLSRVRAARGERACART